MSMVVYMLEKISWGESLVFWKRYLVFYHPVEMKSGLRIGLYVE